MSYNVTRLQQALEHFAERSRHEDLPRGVKEAVQGLQKALATPSPLPDSPGSRAPLRAVAGTRGTGEDMSKAARGKDGPSPGQDGLTAEINRAAASIAARISGGVDGGSDAD